MIKSENLEGFQKLLIEYHTECVMCETHPNVSSVNSGWERLGSNKNWYSPDHDGGFAWGRVNFGIRRKKKTVKINDFDVVPPIVDRLPELGQKYYHLIKIHDDIEVIDYIFCKDTDDNKSLRYGWHENKEEAQSYWKARFSDIKTSYGDE